MGTRWKSSSLVPSSASQYIHPSLSSPPVFFNFLCFCCCCFQFCLFVSCVNLFPRNLLGHFGKIEYFTGIDMCELANRPPTPFTASPPPSWTSNTRPRHLHVLSKLSFNYIMSQARDFQGQPVKTHPQLWWTWAEAGNGGIWSQACSYPGLWQREKLGPIETPAAREKQIDSQWLI